MPNHISARVDLVDFVDEKPATATLDTMFKLIENHVRATDWPDVTAGVLENSEGPSGFPEVLVVGPLAQVFACLGHLHGNVIDADELIDIYFV